MQFDEAHKCKWWLISKKEAFAYIHFLKIERIRHETGMWEAEWRQFKNPRTIFRKALREFYQSAIKRHEEDIEQIDILIKQVENWFRL